MRQDFPPTDTREVRDTIAVKAVSCTAAWVYKDITGSYPRCARVNCATQVSSSMRALAKLVRTSRKVGRPPVVRPFSRCAVTVGASATNGNSAAVPSCCASRRATCGIHGRGLGTSDGDEEDRDPVVAVTSGGAIKSYRSASTTKTCSWKSAATRGIEGHWRRG